MLTKIEYYDFRKIENQSPDLKGTAKDIHSIYTDGTLFMNTAFKGGEVKRVVYNSESGKWENL